MVDLFEPELHLGYEILVPDIAGWRRSRLGEIPDTAWFEIAPDWVCEVVSSSTELFDRETKLPLYAAAGVDHLWIVDPAARIVEIHRRRNREWELVALHRGDAALTEAPFEALTIDLASLWA